MLKKNAQLKILIKNHVQNIKKYAIFIIKMPKTFFLVIMD